MDPDLIWSDIKNSRFALRKLLVNQVYHASNTSIPKTELTEEKEPHIRAKLKVIAKQIVDCSNTILVDV